MPSRADGPAPIFWRLGQHLPLNRQVERFEREGVPLSLSTVADSIGACCAVLDPILKRIEAHTFAAERLHGDDTTVPLLGQERPISPEVGSMSTTIDRSAAQPHRQRCSTIPVIAGEHRQAHLAGYSGILQADAYTGYTKVYLPDRRPGR